jgi:hypothetical protein
VAETGQVFPPLPPKEPEVPPPPPPGSCGSLDEDSVDVTHDGTKMSYKEKLLLAQSLLPELELKEELKSQTFFSSKEASSFLKLPPAPDFKGFFDDFEDELLAKEGSRRAKTQGGPYESGFFPAKAGLKLNNYPVADPMWNIAASKTNPALFHKSLSKTSQPPQAQMDLKALANWETSQREMIAMANHSHWFIKATLSGLTDLQQALHSEPPFSFDQLQSMWNRVEDFKELLLASGRGVEDMTKLAVLTSSNIMLTRRDAWLKQFHKQIPSDLKTNLRNTDLQGNQLFDESLVQETIVQAEKSQSDQRQNRLISGIWDLSRKAAPARPVAGSSGFTRKPFTQTQNSTPQASNKEQDGKQYDKRPYDDKYTKPNQSFGNKSFERKKPYTFQKGGYNSQRGGGRKFN